jgi:hypothetical protein
MYSTPPNFQGSITPNNFGVGPTRQQESQTRLNIIEDNRIHEEIKTIYDNNRTENLIKLREAQLKQGSKNSSVVDDNISDLSDGMKTNSNPRGTIISSQLGSQKAFRNPISQPFTTPSINNKSLNSKEKLLNFETIYEENPLIKNNNSVNKDSNLNLLETRNKTYNRDVIPSPRAAISLLGRVLLTDEQKKERKKESNRIQREKAKKILEAETDSQLTTDANANQKRTKKKSK